MRNMIKAAAFIAASLSLAAPALAHPKLLSSTPKANGTASNIKQITLTFSEGLVAPVSGADLNMTMANDIMSVPGLTTAVGKDGKTLVATLAKPLPAGKYSLNWHVVSTDTHRITGKLAFTVR